MHKEKALQQTQYFLSQKKPYLPDLEKACKEIWILRESIKFHNHCYYSLADPLIADSEYDTLIDMLHQRENAYPQLIKHKTPSQQIGSTVLEWFKKKEHRQTLLSLQNTYNHTDIKERWDYLTRQYNEHIDGFLIEAKMDWSSVEIVYTYWKLTAWITRWDWKIWEDISQHVRYLTNLPSTIPAWEKIEAVHLRWEIVMPQKAFEKTNNNLAAQWERVFSNTRNAAAWTLRQLQPSLVEKRWLIIYCFECLYASSWFEEITHWSQMMNYLEQVWIPIFPRYKTVQTIDQVRSICADENIKKKTQDGSITCDGLVIKVDNLSIRESLWTTQHHPKRAIAFKYPAQEIDAYLESISLQVWRTWVITPLANITPVTLSWVVISKATLHNFDFIDQRDIRVWDRIRIKRSGEVIPYVIWPIPQRRSEDSRPYTIPTHCPACQHILVNDQKHVALLCTNPDCAWKIIAALQHFTSRQCLDIVWLWDALIELLVQAGLVRTVSDIFLLPTPQKKQLLAALPWIWQKKVTQIINEINAIPQKPLRRLLHWLWIWWIWKKWAQSLAKRWTEEIIIPFITKNNQLPSAHPSKFYEACKTYSQTHAWEEIFGIWKVTAEAIDHFIRQQENTLFSLIAAWCFDQWKTQTNTKTASSAISGKTVVLTGTLPVSRDTLTETLASLWVHVSSSISQKTTMLIAWTWWWSKRKKAESLLIPILSYQELLDQYPEIKEQLKNSSQDAIHERETPWIQQTSLF